MIEHYITVNGVTRLMTPEESAELEALQNQPIVEAVPTSVTMRQCRLQLFAEGLLSSVDAVIETLDEPLKTKAKIEWEYGATVERHSTVTSMIGLGLGKSESELDTMFIAANKL